MEITENELIRRIRHFEQKDSSVLRGIGDDGAVVNIDKGKYVFVQDALVEHIHFEFSFMDAFSVGKKAIYVNVSDILSMGARPLYYLVTAGIPNSMSFMDIKHIYNGMKHAAKEFNITLLGGDTVKTRNDFFIDVSMTGELVGDSYFGRNKADEGDYIAVTGFLGESGYGLYLLQSGHPPYKKNRFIRRYTQPCPPYDVWKELIKRGITDSMMDISDGLIIDLERMMAESKKCAIIHVENIPIPAALRKNGKENLAFSGGEDYQLLFTFGKDKMSDFEEIRKSGFHISLIGNVVKGKGVKLFKGNKQTYIDSKGYDHFGKDN